jgi:ribosome biogenesis GTPase / thiamine phosphate phosphatase
MQGMVLKSTGSWYLVQDAQKKQWTCRIRGKIRLQGLRTTNPIAVGDIVDFEQQGELDDQGVIDRIHDRKNYIIRKSVNLSKEAHIVASNLDQALLFITLKKPSTSTGFVDRFLVTAEAYSIPVVLVFNKVDIYDKSAMEEMAVWREVYESIGYESVVTSAVEAIGLEEVKALLDHKVTLLSGHSGVGKSTLINAIEPGLDLKTAEVSDSHNKGKHTTTYAEVFPLSNEGFIIDTPGIKGFGLIDIPKEELHHYFPEMFALLPECKFHNCLHLTEPGCAVVKAVESGLVPATRYHSYRTMYEQDGDETYRGAF